MFTINQLMKQLGLTLLLLLITSGVVAADLEAVTSDGRKVILRSDNTWQYVDDDGMASEDSELEKLLLSLRRIDGGGATCSIVVRLDNTSTYRVKSLVPQFSAYNKDNVALITKFEDFLSIKPTSHQDAEVDFRAVRCDEIAYIKVHGGDKCTMDDMVRFSSDKGKCLKRVKVIPSELVQFSK